MPLEPLSFVIESGTDVRLVEGLASHFALTILARRILGGVEISQPTDAPFKLIVGPPARLAFARFVFGHLWRSRAARAPILVQGYALAALAVNLFARLTGTPAWMLVCSPVEAYYRCRRKAGAAYDWRQLLALRAIACINGQLGRAYLVLSRHLERTVRGHGTRRPVHRIPIYGVDTVLFAPAHSARLEVRRSIALPIHGFWIFFSSRIAPEKDSETLLRAVQALVLEGRPIYLLHRSGGYRQFFQDAARFDLADRIFATDALYPGPELARSYQACDLCVQASLEEGLGFSALEALACGIPVVAARAGGLIETIRDGETGYTYPVGDAPALARTIARAMDSPAQARHLAYQGRLMVEKHFSACQAFDDFARLVNANPKAATRSHAARS